ncbi:MAG: TGS domain-containing protein [Candidatus Lokiarchaeota archaeon]|nr:TGS domain-containing protein [Candidatus Lokiarchaeota archaeon]
MSSNIGPEAQAKYQQYLDAKTIDEKIKKLEEFLSLVPKHKATEKIVALNKSRLAKLKRQQEKNREIARSAGKVVSPFSIKKEEIQLILISDYYNPGVGKTSLLNYLTGAAKDKIGRFTPVPEIGIYTYDKIRFQMIDMPSIMEDASKGVGNGKEILAALRTCDLICICVDLSRDIDRQIELILEELYNADIRINVDPPPISIEKTGANKIQVFFLTKELQYQDDMEEFSNQIKELVFESGIRNAVVKIFGEITLRQIVDALNPAVVYKKSILLGTKGDLPHTEEAFEKMKEKYSDKFPIIIGTSVEKDRFPSDFGAKILSFLNKIKVYTMNSGKVSDKPLIMQANSNVKDVALKIHKSLYELFDYATIIRKGARQKRKKVGLDYPIENNDIIEIHTIA